jgi:hypothetical protein
MPELSGINMEINDLREFDHKAIAQKQDVSPFSVRRFLFFYSPIQSN